MPDHQQCIAPATLQGAIDARDLRIGRLTLALEVAQTRAAQAEQAVAESERLLGERDAKIAELRDLIDSLADDDDDEEDDDSDA
jgi:hypothetical protein